MSYFSILGNPSCFYHIHTPFHAFTFYCLNFSSVFFWGSHKFFKLSGSFLLNQFSLLSYIYFIIWSSFIIFPWPKYRDALISRCSTFTEHSIILACFFLFHYMHCTEKWIQLMFIFLVIHLVLVLGFSCHVPHNKMTRKPHHHFYFFQQTYNQCNIPYITYYFSSTKIKLHLHSIKVPISAVNVFIFFLV